MSDSRSGWELTKENIEPLSGGRRMADLAGALPTRTATGLTDQLQYEEFHLKEIEKLEGIAKQKKGNDPLRAWVILIKYFQQHFPNMTHNIRLKYSKVLSATVNEFYGDERYKNEEAYVKIVVTAMKCYPPTSQIKILTDFLNDGIGEYLDEMYLRLGELYNGEGETKKACDILKKGISKTIESPDKLQDMLTFIQECWAKNYAKQMQSSDGDDLQSDDRRFASSVPIVGEKNEAVSIRLNLQPAAPTNTSKQYSNVRQNAFSQKLSVFNEENVSSQSEASTDHSTNRHAGPLDRLESFNSAEYDRENRLEACRWNAKHTQLETPVIPEPPEKLELFVDKSLPSTSASVKSQATNKRALMERKEPELPEAESLPVSFQPIVAAAPVNGTKDTMTEPPSATISKHEASVLEIQKIETNVKSKSFSWQRNYDPAKKDNFWQNMKYKPLPPGRVASYIMLKCDKWLAEREKKLKAQEAENNELVSLQKRVSHLSSINENLSKEMEHLKTFTRTVQMLEDKLKEQKHLSELKLFEKEERISNLESQNEDLLNKLTRMSTAGNVRESQLHRLESEKAELEQEVWELKRKLEEERQQHVEEIQICKRNYDALRNQDFIIAKQIKQENPSSDESEYEKERSTIGKKQSFVDIHVQSRTAYSISSPSTDQGTDEITRFHSGDTTVEQQQNSVVGSSFMPDLGAGEKSQMMMSIDDGPVPRQALGMVDRPLKSDMMNMTPVAPPSMDFDIPPPSFGGNLFKRPLRMFSLYESISDSMSSKSTRETNNAASNRRAEFVKNLQALPENQPPPVGPQVMPTFNSDENVPPVLPERPAAIMRTEDHFRWPALPSDENVIPTLPKPRRSILLARPLHDDSSDDEEDVILRRHQQTGIDLNISNLTTALALGPRPLINSTPEHERERTIRIPPIAPKNLLQEIDEQPASDSQTNRASRFSMLNDPPLNLSTIQETSRENRSRSTTGSSSGNTMSSTRFGTASNSTQYCSNLTGRSASVPRSASRISQHNNNNGYHSDTNGMQ